MAKTPTKGSRRAGTEPAAEQEPDASTTRPTKSGKADRTAKTGRSSKAEKPQNPGKADKPGKTGKADKPGKAEKPGKAGKADKAADPEAGTTADEAAPTTKDAGGAKDKGAKKAKKARKKLAEAVEQAVAATAAPVPEDRPAVVDPAPAAPPQERDAVFGDEDFTFSATLRAQRGYVLADLDTRSTPGYDGGKKSAALDLAAGQAELSDLQERLWANGQEGEGPAVLLLVQGMDTSGKGGIMRHVVGSTDPGGVRYTAFKAPTPEERAHDFLWRIRRALPDPGQLGVFDRSQYEDVLVVRVHDLVPRSEWMRRYAQINAFERECAARGITVVKVMLAISREEQRERLTERIERPDKRYKYNPGDIDERRRWDDYMAAYQAVVAKTSTKATPWHVVPADRKWYARLAVQQILLEHLRGLDLTWPEGDFDVATELERLADS